MAQKVDLSKPRSRSRCSASFSSFLRDNRTKLSTRYPFLTQDQILSRLRQQWRKENDSVKKRNTPTPRPKEKSCISSMISYNSFNSPQYQITSHLKNGDKSLNTKLEELYEHFQDEEMEMDSPLMHVNDALRKLNNYDLLKISKGMIPNNDNSRGTTQSSPDNPKNYTIEGVWKSEKRGKSKILENNCNEKHSRGKYENQAFHLDQEKGRSRVRGQENKTTKSKSLQNSSLIAVSSTSGKHNEKSRYLTNVDLPVVKAKSNECILKQSMLQKDWTPIRVSKRLANKSTRDLETSNSFSSENMKKAKGINEKFRYRTYKCEKEQKPGKKCSVNKDKDNKCNRNPDQNPKSLATPLGGEGSKTVQKRKDWMFANSIEHKNHDARTIEREEIFAPKKKVPQSKFSHTSQKQNEFSEKHHCVQMKGIKPKKEQKLAKKVWFKNETYAKDTEEIVLPQNTVRQCKSQSMDSNGDGNSFNINAFEKEIMGEKKENPKIAIFAFQEDSDIEASHPKFSKMQSVRRNVFEADKREYEQENWSSQDVETIPKKDSKWKNGIDKFNEPLGLLFQDPDVNEISCVNTPQRRRLLTSATVATPSNFRSMFENDPFDIFF